MPDTHSITKDKFALLLMIANAALALLATVSIVLRLGGDSGEYITQYRSSLSLDAFVVGDVFDMLAFPLFFVLITAFALLMARKVYRIANGFAYVFLGLNTFLLILGLIISNSLLTL